MNPAGEDRPFSRQTFESFVVGESNRLAYEASLRVADGPGGMYNPLVIVGGPGTGKTHLCNAIANRWLAYSFTSGVHILSSESFVNELIGSIRLEKMEEFRRKYREECNALIIEDIQFLAKKTRTQEEVFFLFNKLHDSGKQVVLTCGCFLPEIPEVYDVLRSRFQWGLVVDVQDPEFPVRLEILRRLAARNNLNLPADVMEFVASRDVAGITALESMFNNLRAWAELRQPVTTVEQAREVLGHLFKESEAPATRRAWSAGPVLRSQRSDAV